MKNEKICVNKRTGLIALIGALLTLFVLLSIAINRPTSTNSRASGDCVFSYNGARYVIPLNECLRDVVPMTYSTFKCTASGIAPDASCSSPTPAPGRCMYGGKDVTATLNADKCIMVNGMTNGYRCSVDATGAFVAGKNGVIKDLINCSPGAASCRGTCAGGIAIGSCAPKSIKYCQCSKGKTYPTYVDNQAICGSSVTPTVAP